MWLRAAALLLLLAFAQLVLCAEDYYKVRTNPTSTYDLY
jgi:DnaJ-related protein SCJ1